MVHPLKALWVGGVQVNGLVHHVTDGNWTEPSLSPKDLISVEGSCSRLRSVVVHYNAYRHKLDRILRSKKLNNYMLLSERSAQKKSNQEVSQYYKYRLYKYVYRSRLKPIPPSDDDYLRTYKTKQKQEELDSLVAEQTRRLSLKLILWFYVSMILTRLSYLFFIVNFVCLKSLSYGNKK